MTSVLNIGAGKAENPKLPDFFTDEIVYTRLDGDANTNPDIVHDIREEFPEEMVDKYDCIIMSHILEHISWRESIVALYNVSTVVKPGGLIIILVPNLEWACDQILRGNYDFGVLGVFYGGQATEWDYHRCGYTRNSLIVACERVGLKVRDIRTGNYLAVVDGVNYTAKQTQLVAEKPL